MWFVLMVYEEKAGSTQEERPCPVRGCGVLVKDRADLNPFLHDPGMVGVCAG